ncbi:hypothetical protein [Mesorhizobium sp.]|uniref:hypothetical protein n=1 Tax=Mesorhizobium sp. TaxID=1871066 RepID=UPI000FE801E3|nr:hypothetical protein [Mesorhizobium sp.]RWK57668.1 MAG: hypothetical protein EOR48_00425 [Mesorhizobium sp.]TIP47399.1 MAG: hypothetical protein E5X62_06385 [Mesorhizobium sp.]
MLFNFAEHTPSNPCDETGSALVVTKILSHYLNKCLQFNIDARGAQGMPLGAGISPFVAKGATPNLDAINETSRGPCSDCRNSAACRKLQLKEEIESYRQMAKYLGKRFRAQVEPVLRETGMARRAQTRDNDHRKCAERIWRRAESLSAARMRQVAVTFCFVVWGVILLIVLL